MYCDILVSHVLSVVIMCSMDLQLKHYRKNLSKSKEENLFLYPWGGVVCRNCNALEDLLAFQNIAQYKESDKPMWLLLSLVLFRENVRQFQYI